MRTLLLSLILAALSGQSGAQENLQIPRLDGASITVKTYRPGSAAGQCPPLAIISHGAGGSEKGLAYLALALRDAGWLALVPAHRESGLDVLRSDIRAAGLRGGLLKLVTNHDAYSARFRDLEAIRSWARKSCTPPFTALLGHSMGAATVMVEAGAQNLVGQSGEDRFDAYVALSPQGSGSVFPSGAWRNIKKPVLLLTGTQDKALEGSWETRLTPYADLPSGCKWMGVIDQATHMDFGGNGATDPQEITAVLTLSFLNNARQGSCNTPPKLNSLQLQTK